MLRKALIALPIAGAIGMAAPAVHADESHPVDPLKPLTSLWDSLGLEFQGYFRAGTGGNTRGGGKNECYQLPGAGAKDRLGNECEVYGEISLGGVAYKGSDGSEFDFHTMLAYSNAGQDDPETSWTSFRQAWVEGKNLFKGSDISFWAGKRYYRREDIHQMDFFYWNPTGTGGGFENLGLGTGKLAYAFFHTDKNDVATNLAVPVTMPVLDPHGNVITPIIPGNPDTALSYHDLRVYDIPVNRNGLLDVGTDIAQGGSAPTGSKANPGFMVTIQHKQKGVFFGSADTNKAALQYGQGSFAYMTGNTTSGGNGPSLATYATLNQKYRGQRFIDYYVADVNPSWSFGFDTIIERHEAPVQDCASTFATDNGCTRQTWYSFDLRPMYHITDHLALQFEVGHDIVSPQGAPDREMTKFTFAPTLTTGRGFFDRPQIRAYVTYATWNDAARKAGLVVFNSRSQTTTDTEGVSFGVQTEIWW